MPLDCLLIADDLTGACDAGVPFAMRGRRTTVPLSPDAALPDADVLAISSESRDLPPAAIREAILSIGRLPIPPPRILFKKIDSTLRGQPGLEIATAREAFGCDAAIVCPAFPAMHRVVRSGSLRIEGSPDFPPIAIAACLRAQGAEPCIAAEPETLGEAIRSGARVLVLDAVYDQDLDRMAAAGLNLPLRILWSGSAGLASALARTLPFRPQVTDRPSRGGAVLLCIGSDHRVTLAQQSALLAQRQALLLEAGPAAAPGLRQALDAGRPVLLRIPRGQVSPESVRELVARAPASAIVLSGGDTASLLCRATGVRQIDLCTEIVPGVPYGAIRGGAWDGRIVATKSGGFGDPDALIQIVDYFACQNQ